MHKTAVILTCISLLIFPLRKASGQSIGPGKAYGVTCVFCGNVSYPHDCPYLKGGGSAAGGDMSSWMNMGMSIGNAIWNARQQASQQRTAMQQAMEAEARRLEALRREKERLARIEKAAKMRNIWDSEDREAVDELGDILAVPGPMRSGTSFFGIKPNPDEDQVFGIPPPAPRPASESRDTTDTETPAETNRTLRLQSINPFGDFLFHGVSIRPDNMSELVTRHLDPDGIAAESEQMLKEMRKPELIREPDTPKAFVELIKEEPVEVQADMLAARADVYRAEGNKTMAIEHLDKAAELDPDNAMVKELRKEFQPHAEDSKHLIEAVAALPGESERLLYNATKLRYMDPKNRSYRDAFWTAVGANDGTQSRVVQDLTMIDIMKYTTERGQLMKESARAAIESENSLNASAAEKVMHFQEALAEEPGSTYLRDRLMYWQGAVKSRQK